MRYNLSQVQHILNKKIKFIKYKFKSNTTQTKQENEVHEL